MLVREVRSDSGGAVRARQHSAAGCEGEEGASYGVAGDAARREQEGRRAGKRPLREILGAPQPGLVFRSLVVPLEEALAAVVKAEPGGKKSVGGGDGDHLGGDAGGKKSSGAGSGALESCPVVIPCWGATGKRGRAGKRSRNPDCEADEESDQEVTAPSVAATGMPAAVTAGASKSYRCSTCCKSFSIYQALGGRALGHSKNKKKKDVATTSHEDRNGSSNEREAAVVTDNHEDASANGDAKEEQELVVAVSQEKADDNGNGGNCNKRKVVIAASGRDTDSSGNNVEKTVFADSQGDAHANGNNNKKKAAVAAIPGDASGVGNGNGQLCKVQHICKVCGEEYETGCALGGHMRKHRKGANRNPENKGSSKRPAPAAGVSQRPEAEGSPEGPTAGGSQGPVLRLFGKNISL